MPLIYVAFMLLTSPIVSHSWLDCIGPVSANYSGFSQYFHEKDFEELCLGYPRSYPGRSDKDINTKFTYHVIAKKKDQDICQFKSSDSYSSKFPITKIGKDTQTVKLWWEMDNHPNPKTSVSIYRLNKNTVKFRDLNDTLVVNTMVFASPENCMDINKPNTLCQGNMDVEKFRSEGKASFAWVWHWDYNPSGDDYITCFDLEFEN